LARQHDLDQTWAHIQSLLRTSFPESTYNIWLARLRPAALDHASSTLFIEAAGETGEWLRRRFGAALNEAAREADPSIERVELIGPAQGPLDEPDVTPAGGIFRPHAPAVTFKPGYTFDRFVIGKTNRFAHAAALAAAELPGHAYNPLLIHGPPGVGKTHLLQAIGNYVSTHDTNLTVRYTTTEGFTGDFTRALKQSTLEEFKGAYRRYDVLLVDDLQFLEGKPRTAEEFLHTFDSLLTSGAQIVISSDCDPAEISFLEARFKERLQGGLTIHLGPPNRNTRLAILRKLAALNELEIPTEVMTQLAERISSNIRALEGALIRVVAFASLSESSITTALADQVLASLYSDEPAPSRTKPRPNADQIQAETASALGLEAGHLSSPGRSRPVVYARQVAMYLCRELAGLSYPEIARHFNRRDHTTALHAHRKVKAQLLSDPETRTLLTTLTNTLCTVHHNPSHRSSTPRTASPPQSTNGIHNSSAPNHY
jgi:chromosomal replication initiator protein